MSMEVVLLAFSPLILEDIYLYIPSGNTFRKLYALIQYTYTCEECAGLCLAYVWSMESIHDMVLVCG